MDLARTAKAHGYDSFWVAEVTGVEAFSVLGAVSQDSGDLALGTGVLPMQVRTPPLLSMAAASLQALNANSDVLLGIGVSSPVVASGWHGADYPSKPLAQVEEFITLLRECLSGDVVNFDGDYYTLRRFRLAVELGDRRPKIILGALGPQMLRLAGRLADGVLLNYLPATHVPWCVEQVRAGGDATIHAYVHVGVGDREAAATQGRFDLFSYVVVPAYARNFRLAGFDDEVTAVLAAHAAGDRAAALAAISDRMLDAINTVGAESVVTNAVTAYRRAGVDQPVIYPVIWGSDDGARALDRTLQAAIA
jgi:probable F420-dependent oxidoreductase